MATGSTEAGTPVPLDASKEVTPANALVTDGAAQTCTSCGGANAPGARFCHECGASLGTAAPVATVAATSALVGGANARPGLEPTVFDQSVAASPVAASPVAASPVAASGALNSSSVSPQVLEVGAGDSASARGLLDRAFNLAERGDMTGAILACRQSVALSPTLPQGFSMLGLLLERSGDLEQAAAAYARVLKLAPGSRLEVESLDRIRTTLAARRGEAPVFRFDGRELDEAVGVAAASSPAASSVVPVAAVAAGVSTAGIALANTAPAPVSYPNAPRPLDVGLPVTSPTSQAGLVAPNISALHFDVADMAPAPWWQRALIRPTAFTRGLPLAAVAGTGLLFMIWGRSAAVSSYAQSTAVPAGLNATPLDQSAVPTLPEETGVAQNPSGSLSQSPVGSNSPTSGQAEAPSVAGVGDSFPITNRPAASPGAASPVPGASSAPAPAGASASGGSASGSGPSQPAAPGGVVAPAVPRVQPVFPSTRRVVTPAIPNNLPPMRLPPPVSQSAPSVTLPRGGGGATGGGGPLYIAPSRNSGSITLSRPRYSATGAPPRPGNIAAEAERRAGTRRPDNPAPAARNGDGTGWSYQTRALTFLERGDYARAADDFQAAISAYRDQIGRGERVAEAQAGLRASQSGLSLAQGSLRR